MSLIKMLKGILFALLACFIWGLIFVIPQFMEGFTSLEVALGRYFFYGLISIIVFLRVRCKGLSRYSSSIWLRALGFSLVSTFGYYIFLVLALRNSTPAISALILGISPIAISFYGNWKQKECNFKVLMFPSLLIFTGLLIINVPQFLKSATPSTFSLGLLWCFCALASWSWYVVANARFLKCHPEISPSAWSTMVGCATLFWVGVVVFCMFINQDIELKKYFSLNQSSILFLIGSAILGFLCSWVGAFLWNKSTLYLPVSLVGQMMIFETLFGLLFVYLVEGRMPYKSENLGMVFLIFAVIYGVHKLTKKSSVT